MSTCVYEGGGRGGAGGRRERRGCVGVCQHVGMRGGVEGWLSRCASANGGE
jgi:hypothetical protein